MLTVQHLSRLGAQGAIVSKGAGPPPLVTGRRVKPIIGEAWEIQYRVGRGRGLHHCWNQLFHCQSQCPDCCAAYWCATPFLNHILVLCLLSMALPALPSSSCHVARPPPCMWPMFNMLSWIVCTSSTIFFKYISAWKDTNTNFLILLYVCDWTHLDRQHWHTIFS